MDNAVEVVCVEPDEQDVLLNTFLHARALHEGMKGIA